jgi:hypothetical protein
MQVVNLSMHGYANDQAYRRLVDILPQFKQPKVILSIFAPQMLDRCYMQWRPHFELDRDQQLVWMPGRSGFFSDWRLRRIFEEHLTYWSDSDLKKYVDVTRAIFRETVALARSRGATPLFVVPSWGPPRALDEHPEAQFLHQIFDPDQLPYVLVDFDPNWTGPNDFHPDARANALIADHVIEALQAAHVASASAGNADAGKSK